MKKKILQEGFCVGQMIN